MIQITNGIIEVCKYKVTLTQEIPAKGETPARTLIRSRYFKTQDEVDEFRVKAEEQGYTVEVEELDVENELFLDGIECSSIEQAKEWLAAGEIIPSLTIESLAELVADIIGGAI